MKEGVRLDRVRGGRQKYRRVDVSLLSFSPDTKSISSLEGKYIVS